MGSSNFDRAGIYCVEDLRDRSKRRLPRFVFDFLDGAAGDESTARRNLAALAECTITPKFGADSTVSLERTIFGRTYSAPFGIAPIGLAELVFPKADMLMAQAAAHANIPYVCSVASGTSVLEIIRRTGRAPWFQLYCARDTSVTNAIIDELAEAEVKVLIVTVDVPVPGKRIRDLRNGLSIPLRPSRRLAWDCVTSPQWAIGRLAAGRIGFPNFERHMGRVNLPFRDIMALQTGGRLDWEWLKWLRTRWRGKLVIKGLMCEQDATTAQHIGVDGLIVSNHGGRQFDGAPASFHRLAPVKAAASGICVMFDSGVRTGTDIVRSMIAGAEIAWIGRPFLYALAAVGSEGPSELIRLLKAETYDSLALAGPLDTLGNL